MRDGAAWQLPFALLPVLHFTSSRKEMGEFRNSTLPLSGNDMVLVGMTLVWLGLPLGMKWQTQVSNVRVAHSTLSLA